MSEPQPPPAPPQPAAPGPFDPSAVRSPVRPGCGKPVLVGCGLFFVLFLAAMVLFTTRIDAILRWWIGTVKTEVERRLPADATAADRQRLDAAFAAAAARAGSGKLDPEPLQKLEMQILSVIGEEKISREELQRVTAALEEFAGTAPPVEQPATGPPATGETPATAGEPPPAAGAPATAQPSPTIP
jgi:hypothetical protein